MFKSLITIIQENWQYRKQINRLAIFDIIKKSRGNALSWLWLILKPFVYILVLWFVLGIGLRSSDDDPLYFLWLISGLIPWFYISDMLKVGSDVFRRYAYLVNKIKFPISGIPTIHNLSTLLIHLILVVLLFVISLIMGITPDIYLIQLPLIILLMVLFFNVYSMMTSLMSALSRDFASFISVTITPLFWISGILFPVSNLDIQWIKTLLLFNPITFFTTAYRDVFYGKAWIWDSPATLGAFALVFLATLIIMLFLYNRLSEVISDDL